MHTVNKVSIVIVVHVRVQGVSLMGREQQRWPETIYEDVLQDVAFLVRAEPIEGSPDHLFGDSGLHDLVVAQQVVSEPKLPAPELK